MKQEQSLLNRRKWLTLFGLGSGSLLLGMTGSGKKRSLYDQHYFPVSIKEPLKRSGPVSLVKGDDRHTIIYSSLKKIENDIIKAIGNKNILIKPNLVAANSPKSVTDPIAVKAILDFLKPFYKKQVVIGESTAVYKQEGVNTLDLFRQYGYSGLADSYNVKFIDLNACEFEYRYVWSKENEPKFIRISKPLLDPQNFIISVPRMKTHSHCIVTLSLKNILMAAPINDYVKNDWRVGDKFDVHVISETAVNSPLFYNLFQMAHYTYPDLAVIDGFEGMEGNGPTGGNLIPSKMAISSLDALAADTVGAAVMGFDPGIIPYLKFLNQGGFGQGNLNDIEIAGTPISQCRMKFKPADAVIKVFNLA